MRMMKFVCAALALLLAAGGAEACRVRRPPAIPILHDYDAVTLATVIRAERHWAEVRFDDVITGRVDREVARLDYGTWPSESGIVVISCGPPGPAVQAGDEVVVVFGRNRNGQFVQGWVTRADAERNDDFFGLYRRVRDPADRRRVRQRWLAVNRYQGPVPRSDPARWMAPHAGGLGWSAEPDAIAVRFDIDRTGRIADCSVQDRRLDVGRNRTICASLRDRRFRPPLFARERHGSYWVRWRDAP